MVNMPYFEQRQGGELGDVEVKLNPVTVTNGDIGTEFRSQLHKTGRKCTRRKEKRHREQEKILETRSCNNRSSS